MKLLLLFVAIPLVASAFDAESSIAMHFIKELSEAFNQLPSGPNKPIDQDVRANPIYKLIINLIKKKLIYEIDVPVIGKPEGFLYVENGTIVGANETYINIDAPNAGYNMDNLTVYIPSLDIFADKYIINNLAIQGISLNGDGQLHIFIENIRVYARMEISFESLKFVVKTITALELYMEDSKLELTNLGGSGEAVSSLLNDIATKMLPVLVRSFSNDLQDLITLAKGDCHHSDLELVCGLISSALTYMKNNLL